METLAFFRDPDFAQSRFERYGDVYETSLLGQRTVFIRGEKAINDLFNQADAVEGWWPESVKTAGVFIACKQKWCRPQSAAPCGGSTFYKRCFKSLQPNDCALS